MARKLDYGTESHRAPTVRTTCRRPGCTSDATEKNHSGLMQCQQHAEQEHLIECKSWLAREGIARHELTGSDRMKALARYRNATSKAERPGDKVWAYALRAKYLEGDTLIPVQIDLASAALRETWKDRDCLPA